VATANYVDAPLLRYWRQALAVGQTELASDAGTSPATIRRLEHGGRTSPETLQLLVVFQVERLGHNSPGPCSGTRTSSPPVTSRRGRPT
jgi:DNA-binding XRE family transcriptional regulator